MLPRLRALFGTMNRHGEGILFACRAQGVNMLTSNSQDTKNKERTDIVTEKQLMKLAGKIGSNWQRLGIEHLDFSMSEIDQFNSDGADLQLKVFRMLNAWRNRQKPPTIQSLLQIFGEANIDYEALEYLKNECNTVNGNISELLCKCCQAVDCSCNCINSQEIIATTPDPNQYKCIVKIHLQKFLKPFNTLENLFENVFTKDPNLYIDFKTIIHDHESEILKIAKGCIEFHLQLRSYMALLNLTLLHHGTVSEGIKQLPRLHQKIQDVLMEELPRDHIIPEMFSFQNIFDGGSYRSALEFFCGGFSIDEMLPIMKKQKLSQHIDYLCIDINSSPQSTLTDLKNEFIKKRDRALRNLKRKLEEESESQNDLKFVHKLIDYLLNKSCRNQGKSCKKSRESGKKHQSVKTTERKESCELEIPERKAHQLESTVEAKHLLDFDAEKLSTSNKPALKQMKVSSYFQKEEFKATPSSVTMKKDSVQVKSEEQSVRRKEKQSREIDLAKKTRVSTPIEKDIKKEADTKEHTDVPVTKKHPKRKGVTGGQRTRKTTRAKMQAKIFEVLFLSMMKRKPRICYGCRKKLVDGEGPHLILKTEDIRDYYSGYKRKQLAFKPSNVYFHVNKKCVENRYRPFSQHEFTVPVNVLKHLNSTQFTMLKSMNIIQDADDTK